SLGNTSAIGVDPGTTLTINGGVFGSNTSVLQKVGLGTLFFPVANPYFSETLVIAGILNAQDAGSLGAIGGDGVLIGNGATLQIQGNITVKGKSLQLYGSGFKGRGDLEIVSGYHYLLGKLVSQSDITINTGS